MEHYHELDEHVFTMFRLPYFLQVQYHESTFRHQKRYLEVVSERFLLASNRFGHINVCRSHLSEIFRTFKICSNLNASETAIYQQLLQYYKSCIFFQLLSEIWNVCLACNIHKLARIFAVFGTVSKPDRSFLPLQNVSLDTWQLSKHALLQLNTGLPN